MKYRLSAALSLLSNSLLSLITVCLLSIFSDLKAADSKYILSQNTDLVVIASSNGNTAKMNLFRLKNITQSELLLQSYADLQSSILTEDFMLDDLFAFNSRLAWQNIYFTQQYFKINPPKETLNFSHHPLIRSQHPIQYYQAQLATYNKNKTIMATLAYESAQNNQMLDTRQANLEADISFYNPYKYFSRVNLNYKKSLVGIEMSQLGMGLTFYGELNFSILSSLSIEDINNNRFPKKMNLGIGISKQL